MSGGFHTGFIAPNVLLANWLVPILAPQKSGLSKLKLPNL
jgi:hypothetical protein